MYNRQSRIELNFQPKSLCWKEGELIDYVAGGTIWTINGDFKRNQRNYAYRFDAAVTSPCKRYSVIYERLGTKGLILRGLDVVREINRSFYTANAFEYPVLLFVHSDGETYLAHCPEKYNQLEIEHVETGERLKSHEPRNPQDFFVSRLQISPCKKFMVSAGWIWHPVETLFIWDVPSLFQNINHADSGRSLFDLYNFEEDGEVVSVCFLNDQKICVAVQDEYLKKYSLVGFEIATGDEIVRTSLENNAGTIFAVNDHHVLSLMDHPKLINIESGDILKSWQDIESGQQDGSISHQLPFFPVYAFDKRTKNFAIVQGKEIVILHYQ